ncbi:hypothetical protein EHP00_769 [Ecytonucleospora hepatopenaei]|uniref:Uncharacterized protein n=1 Tax=Ecytonucleospora hepatopenaei TaxID=646526 RepID=A0A1W0E664_9MICR|nr:hypothetical protein EHP00_769 [Ecytonucleospora hepatopenaei]
MSKHINYISKRRILALRDENYIYKEIYNKAKIPLATVGRIIKNSMERGTTDRKYDSETSFKVPRLKKSL